MDDERHFSFRCKQGEKSDLKRNGLTPAAQPQPSWAVYSLVTQVSKHTMGVHMGTGRGSYGLQNHWVNEFRNGFASKEPLHVCG